MKYGRRFLCRKDQMWQDSWTYGEWRQYICNRPNGQTQCARISKTPMLAAWFGLMLLVACIYGLLMGFEPNWPALILNFVISSVAIGLYLVSYIKGVYLMVPVGPMNEGTRRVCPWDLRRDKEA